jgi:hypothetical protein
MASDPAAKRVAARRSRVVLAESRGHRVSSDFCGNLTKQKHAGMLGSLIFSVDPG